MKIILLIKKSSFVTMIISYFYLYIVAGLKLNTWSANFFSSLMLLTYLLKRELIEITSSQYNCWDTTMKIIEILSVMLEWPNIKWPTCSNLLKQSIHAYRGPPPRKWTPMLKKRSRSDNWTFCGRQIYDYDSVSGFYFYRLLHRVCFFTRKGKVHVGS